MGAQYNGADGGDGGLLRGKSRPIVLDGALGTELEARGLRCDLPLWSAWAVIEAPDAVADIHRAYVRAGADWLTANTFRTQARHLAAAGCRESAESLTQRAVALARGAAQESGAGVLVLGSMAPLEDCYRPDLVPATPDLVSEHTAQAAALAAAGADAILLETLNCIREARVAAAAACETGLPCWVSFAVDAQGRLLSGEPLDQALDAASALPIQGVGVNCLAPSAVPGSLDALRGHGRPFSIHTNLGAPRPGGGFREPLSPEGLAGAAEGWISAGAAVIGGCCGTTPAHTRALVQLVSQVTETGR